MVLVHRRLARKASFFSGMLLLAWVVLQLANIGYVSWLQPAIVMSAVLILVLARIVPDATSVQAE